MLLQGFAEDPGQSVLLRLLNKMETPLRSKPERGGILVWNSRVSLSYGQSYLERFFFFSALHNVYLKLCLLLFSFAITGSL